MQGHVGEDEMDVDEPEEAGLETTGATMDVDDSSAPEEVAAKEGEDDSLSDAPGKGDSKRTSDKAKKNEDNEDNNKKETEAVLRRAKPISLSAVPSFYEQDYRRIYLIHREMVATSLHDHSRRRVEEVVKAYNLGEYGSLGRFGETCHIVFLCCTAISVSAPKLRGVQHAQGTHGSAAPARLQAPY